MPGAAVYWFLICSGYRTYRFLPVFFREFFPTHRRPTPAGARRVLDTLATRKFPTTYDATAGVIRPRPAARLRPGVAEVGPGGCGTRTWPSSWAPTPATPRAMSWPAWPSCGRTT